MVSRPEIDELLPYAEDAVRSLGLSMTAQALAEQVIANWSTAGRPSSTPNPSSTSGEPTRVETAGSRVFIHWHLGRDHRRAATDLKAGWPFAAFEFFGQQGCHLGRACHGTLFRQPADLPSLPLAGCPAAICRCSLIGVVPRRHR